MKGTVTGVQSFDAARRVLQGRTISYDILEASTQQFLGTAPTCILALKRDETDEETHL
jgi:hypothetical protein